MAFLLDIIEDLKIIENLISRENGFDVRLFDDACWCKAMLIDIGIALLPNRVRVLLIDFKVAMEERLKFCL